MHGPLCTSEKAYKHNSTVGGISSYVLVPILMVFTSICLCLYVYLCHAYTYVCHRWTSMLQWHICMISICIFTMQWHKYLVSNGAMIHLHGSREKVKHTVHIFLCDIIWCSMHDVHKVMAIMIDL